MKVNLLLLALVFQVTDCISTRAVLANGFEANPLYGPNPDLLTVLLLKLVFLMLFLQNWPQQRRLVLSAFVVMGVIATGWNVVGLTMVPN